MLRALDSILREAEPRSEHCGAEHRSEWLFI